MYIYVYIGIICPYMHVYLYVSYYTNYILLTSSVRFVYRHYKLFDRKIHYN